MQVARPFEGLAAECDLVALREFVPSATATLSLREGALREVGLREPGRPVLVGTVLPLASAALVRAAPPAPGAADGEPGGGASTEDGSGRELGLLGLQVQQASSGDLSRDLGRALAWVLDAPPGASLQSVPPDAPDRGAPDPDDTDPDDTDPDDTDPDGPDPVPAPRLQDLLARDTALAVSVFDDFDWWVPGDVPAEGEVADSLARATEAIMPTALVEADGVRSAWWVDAGEKAHLRWVRGEDEDALMLALARVHAAGALTLGEGSRFAGSFRAHGLLVPVFDLDRERHAQEWASATAALGVALDEALAQDGPLTPPQRRSRDGLRSRQVTIR